MRNFNYFLSIFGAAAITLSAASVLAQKHQSIVPGYLRDQTPISQLISNAQERAKNAESRIEGLRQQAEARVKKQQEKLKQKLTEIKDKQKQQLAQNIANQFAHINKIWTDHFTQLLNHYDAVLQKIQIRDDKAAANGKDVTAVNAAIQSAKTTIASARSAVEAQAQKTYVADTSGVSGQNQLMQKLRSVFKTLRDQLFRDLFALRDGAVKDARISVQNALKSLSQVPGVDEEPAATSTPANK